MRLEYFDTSVTPVMMFALHVLPLTKTQLNIIDTLQRKMIRRIVGWTRAPDESWHGTMVRMNGKLITARSLHYCPPWSHVYSRAQWRFADHVAHAHPLLWSRQLSKFCVDPIDDPVSEFEINCARGRPRLRWDDGLNNFCKNQWPGWRPHWTEAMVSIRAKDREDDFVVFMSEHR